MLDFKVETEQSADGKWGYTSFKDGVPFGAGSLFPTEGGANYAALRMITQYLALYV